MLTQEEINIVVCLKTIMTEEKEILSSLKNQKLKKVTFETEKLN